MNDKKPYNNMRGIINHHYLAGQFLQQPHSQEKKDQASVKSGNESKGNNS